MLLFDYRNQNLINYQFVMVGIIFLLIGLFAFFISFKMKPEIREDFSTRLLCFSRERLEEHARFFPPFVKLFGIFLFLFSVYILYIQLEPTIYLKNVNSFENINSLSTRIDSLETNNLLEMNTITLYVKDKSFTIIKDSRYVGYRNLMSNDSIRIEYFEKESSAGHMKTKYFEVTRIELK